jgi:thiamine kinase-like enzyme
MILSHNDVNMTNCIWSPDKKLTIIDFEFASLNYVGFDIGNLFNEVATQYSEEF